MFSYFESCLTFFLAIVNDYENIEKYYSDKAFREYLQSTNPGPSNDIPIPSEVLQRRKNRRVTKIISDPKLEDEDTKEDTQLDTKKGTRPKFVMSNRGLTQ